MLIRHLLIISNKNCSARRKYSRHHASSCLTALWKKRARSKKAILEKCNFHSLCTFIPSTENKKIMLTKLSHATIYVLNQDSAYDFYVNKLGFKVHTDAPMGPGMRWLTVTPPDQPDLEIVLMSVAEGPAWDKETADAVRKLVKKGSFGFGVFHCKDIYATYEEMKAKGVEFKKAP